MGWPNHYEGFEVFAGRHRLSSDLGKEEELVGPDSGDRREVLFGAAVGGFVELDDGRIFATADSKTPCVHVIDRADTMSNWMRIPQPLLESGIAGLGFIDADRGRSLYVLGRKEVYVISADGQQLRTLHIIRDAFTKGQTANECLAVLERLKIDKNDDSLYLTCYHPNTSRREVYRYQESRELELLVSGANLQEIWPSCVGVHPNGRLCIGSIEDDVIMVNKDGTNAERYVTLDIDDPDSVLYFGGNIIRDIAFDPGGHMYLAGGYKGPFRVDAETRKVTTIGAFPEGAGCGTVHVKRHSPYKGHLLVASLDTILVSDDPVYPPERMP